MEGFDLLSAVQPEGGWYAVVGITSEGMQQELVESREELDKWVGRFLRRKMNVFFGVAKYKDGSSRLKANVQALKAFWLDIDCGPTKDYPTQGEALQDLKKFCRTVGLPRPIVVSSGRGLHVYWPLTEAVTREEWEPVAARLKEVCKAQGLRVDPAVFEAARILRIPGTLNFKGEEPVEVQVLGIGDPLDIATLRETLGVKVQVAPLPASPRQPLSPLGKLLQDSIDTSFNRIMRRGEDGCAQLNACYEEQAVLSEPRWFSALSIAKFCSDRDKAIHKMSAGHPDYDPGRTQQKLAHILGPHTCVEFEKNNPGLCAGCPHFGKIKSPITLGKELREATPEDNEVEVEVEGGDVLKYHIPEYPFPYVRGKAGGIWRKPLLAGDEKEATDEEKEPILVYPYDFYIVKRMEDPVDGSVVLFRFHTPKDGVKEFVLPAATVMAQDELRKALASRHMVLLKKQFDMLIDYVVRSFQQVFHSDKAEQMRNQFGWADNDSKFILGDREISVEGTYHSPPSSVTKVMAEYTVPAGSLEKWKEVFNLYGRKGLEASAFAAATAFGAPLLRFSGQRGAIISLVNTHSGTGKTTILHMANSVWGNPEKLCAKKDDTFNSKVFKLGVLCNLPVTFDEMSNTEPSQLSELAYLITQGTGKDRMKASSNELRVNMTSWQTIALCSSNHSFYEKLEKLKDSPQGEMMRIIEYSLDYSDAIDTETGKKMFDHQLLENYGHAGEIYARYLLAEYDTVKAVYTSMQARIDALLKLTQRERFWSATVAANLTGIYVANHLKLCNWDIGAIFRWACDMIESLRATTTAPPDGDKQILGDFLIGRVDNILIVNDGADRRSKMEEVPLLEPRHEVMVRYEPDTQKVFITANSFHRYCTSRNINYRETLNKLKKTGLYVGSLNKRMTKGMKFSMTTVRALEFDATHPDFVSMDGFIPKEEEGEGSGG
jgi:hypothetical protein